MARGDHDSVVRTCKKLLPDYPQSPQLWLWQGIALSRLRKPREAETSLREAIRLKPDYTDAYLDLANVFFEEGKLDPAAELYRHVLGLSPTQVQPNYNLGVVLKKQGRWTEALACFETVVSQQADFLNAWINIGDVAQKLGQADRAIAAYRQALSLKPNVPEVHNNLAGILWTTKKNYHAAIEHFERALALGLESPVVYRNLGLCLSILKQFGKAESYLHKALALDPHNIALRSDLAYLQMKNCNWSELDRLRENLLLPALTWTGDDFPPVPFPFLSLPIPDIDEAEHQRLASQVARYLQGDIKPAFDLGNRPEHARLRIGYVSADYRDHATVHLMAGLFKRHDRKQFEIYAYAMNASDGSVYRRLVETDCDHFVDVCGLNDEQSARRIHEDEIDILIDLKGYTGDGRPGLFAFRPAPVQAQYLGYPGTMAADFIDYIITDRVVTPPEQQAYYNERFAYLPHSYQINDRDQPIAAPVTRQSQSLPENGFVFCCFCAHHKIEPTMFGIWMNVLKAVPGSVLWLIDGADPAPDNLRREAQSRGVAPDRLIFAPYAPKPEHLSRFRLAGLFLDTYYYNGHTTTSDALWAGVPVLTCPRRTFASRVAASLLQAIGLEEMIVETLDAYQVRAIELATHPKNLAAIRKKLERNRLTRPLFDTDLFTRDLENLYQDLWKNFRNVHPTVQPPAPPKKEVACDPIAAAMDAYGAKDYPVALSHCRRALDLAPQRADLRTLQGMLLKHLDRPTEAIACYRQAIATDPAYADAYNNLANVLRQMGRLGEAAEHYRQAIARKPGLTTAYVGLGGTLQALGDVRGALQAFDQALALEPEHIDAHWDRALALLLSGDLPNGFREYEWRWKRGEPPSRGFTQPVWDGSPFAGRRLLVYSEQGMGDTLQMLRYLPQVVAQGGEVVLEVHRPLVSLAQTMAGPSQIVERGQPLPDFDLHISLMSLPRVFHTDLSSIPNQFPYLHAPSERANHWQRRISRRSGLRVGLVWAGNPNFKNDAQRSPRLRPLLPLLQLEEVNYFLLQKGEAQRELWDVELPSHCVDLADEINDFADTAAIIEQLDLVISADTAVAHLAGTLNKPVWVLLPHAPDWRWLLTRNDTPWYASMRLYRQARRGRWDGVVDEVMHDLRGRIAESPRNPGQAMLLLQQAYGHWQNQAMPDALNHIEQALAADASLVQAWVLKGMILRRLGRWNEAVAAYSQAISLDPQCTDAYNNLGNGYRERGDQEAAIDCYRNALAVNPNAAELWNTMADALRLQGRLSEAEDAVNRALGLYPAFADAYNSLGNILVDRKQLDSGLAAYRKALELDPGLINATYNLGVALQLADQHARAVEQYEHLLARQPRHVQALYNLGLAQQKLKNLDQAESYYRQAMDLDAKHFGARFNQAALMEYRHRTDEALALFKLCLELQPENLNVKCELARIELKLCDWRNIGRLRTDIVEPALHWTSSVEPPSPFLFLTLPTPISEAELKTCAEHYGHHIAARVTPLPPRPKSARRGNRRRIGYLSADFHNHATAHLMLGLFTLHDRKQFEIFAYSLGPDDDSQYRRRIRNDVEHFIDLAAMTDRTAAERIQSDGIELLVDLKGYTRDSRPDILAYRPAPIQAQYLGYPGTMGAKFIDVLISDPTVTPPSVQTHYSERLAYLPHCYQVNDDQQAIAAETPTRQQCGLPERAFVFCCFCSQHKLDPTVFDIWMRLLHAVPDSVLWLIEGHAAAGDNLRREAQHRGVSPKRLVFAPVLPKHLHLARYRLADIFLDTYYYNGHTTASDALWAGLPVITCPGKTFASRVGASLLKAVGMDELIASDLASYEALALRTAREPKFLKKLKTKLRHHRNTDPLFDTAKFTRDLESLYQALLQTS